MDKQIIVVGVLTILILGSFTVWVGSGNAKGNPIKINGRGVRGYIPHGVIRINNNTDFKNQVSQEGWPGDGSQSNPYMISGYDIDAHGAGDAIFIGNTSVYFVVENCYLYNVSWHFDAYFEGGGMRLYNVRNGKISCNTITNNSGGEGIDLDYSSSNTISGNNIKNNWYGIHLEYQSSTNTIYNNLISNNAYYGICIDTSSHNLIYNNIFYFNHLSGGIYNSSRVQAYDAGSNNYWKSSSGIGNYWHDWANNNDTNDQNNNGIVDWPYKIDGSAGAKDDYPLKNPPTSVTVLSPPQNLWLWLIIILIIGGIVAGILIARNRERNSEVPPQEEVQEENEEGMITVTCPKCGFTSQVPANMRGQWVKCPKCGNQFQIP